MREEPGMSLTIKILVSGMLPEAFAGDFLYHAKRSFVRKRRVGLPTIDTLKMIGERFEMDADSF